MVSPRGWVVTAASAVGDDASLRAAAADFERGVIRAAFDDLTSADLGLPAPITDKQRQTLVDAAAAKVQPSVEVAATILVRQHETSSRSAGST